MKYELLNATKDDIGILLDIKENVFREQVKAYYGWDDDYQKQKMLSVLEKWPENVFLVKVEGKIVAILTYFEEEEELVIKELFIRPKYQKIGLGSTLLTDIIRQTNKNIILKVNKRNSALAFYQSLEFQVYGETQTHNLMRFINKRNN